MQWPIYVVLRSAAMRYAFERANPADTHVGAAGIGKMFSTEATGKGATAGILFKRAATRTEILTAPYFGWGGWFAMSGFSSRVWPKGVAMSERPVRDFKRRCLAGEQSRWLGGAGR